MIGIYTITNIIDGKIYVGYSTNISKRLQTHKGRLRRNVHSNLHLQSSVNKYKLHNFKFETLEECEQKFLCSLENYWCNLLNSHNRKFGYNIDSTNPNNIKSKRNEETRTKLKKANLGKIVSKETREKLSLLSKGRKLSEEHKLKMSLSRKGISTTGDKRKKVSQFTIEGNFIKNWSSAKEASKALNIKCASEISSLCKLTEGTSKNKKFKNRKTVGGFIWKYTQN